MSNADTLVYIESAVAQAVYTLDSLTFHLPGQHNQKSHGKGGHGHDMYDPNVHEIIHTPGKMTAFKVIGAPDDTAQPFTVQHIPDNFGATSFHQMGLAPDASHLANVNPSDMKGPQLDLHLAMAGVHPTVSSGMTLKQKKQAIQFMKGYQTYDGKKTGAKVKLSSVAVTSPHNLSASMPSTPHVAPTIGPLPTGSFSIVGGVKTWTPPAGFETNTVTSTLTKHSQDWKASLSYAEKDAIVTYTGNGYSGLNKHLKATKGKPRGSNAATAKLMDSALAKGTLTEDRVFYRGTKINKGENVVGSVIGYDGYHSTSTSEFTAKNFVKKFSGSGSGTEGAFLRIKAPKGTKGGYVNGWSLHGAESEFILPRGTQYKVVGAIQRSNGVWDLEVDILDPFKGGSAP
jgi:hypothetical protein